MQDHFTRIICNWSCTEIRLAMSHITVQNLSKCYMQSNQEHVVLDGLSFEVENGQFVSVLGPSGCGKTTLLTIIAGFNQASQGTVVIGEGRTVVKPGSDRAFVFQNYALFPWMTVKENILFPMKNLGISELDQEERLQSLLQLAQLSHAEYLHPHQLSGGMKQRTALVRALACQPEVLLMDEPLGALDYQMRQELQEEMELIFTRDPVTVLMVTHDVEEAVYMSDRVLLMSTRQGRIDQDLAIDLPRPRNRDAARYQEYVRHLRKSLKKTTFLMEVI